LECDCFPIEVNIMGPNGTLKTLRFLLFRPMAARYGVVPSNTCRICTRATPDSEMHHIISRAKIDRLERDDLEWLAVGIDGSVQIEDLDDDRLRRLVATKIPGNIAEVCSSCHEMTDSHLFRQWIMSRGAKTVKRTRRTWKQKRERYLKKWGPGQEKRCEGLTGKKRRCCASKRREVDYCGAHRHQEYECGRCGEPGHKWTDCEGD
jgi:hypothetical protein